MTNNNAARASEAQEAGVDSSGNECCGAEVPHTHKYPVTIDGQTFKLDTPMPTGEFLLSLVHKRPCADDLFAEYAHHESRQVDPHEVVDLKSHGLKGFVTAAKAIVTIFIDNDPYPIERGFRTVAEILTKVGKTPEGYMLMQDKDGALVPLPIDQPVQISGCEEFFAQVQSGGSSHP